ncbi:trypco2 family protein [Spirillospora sp. CA-255316]
MGELGLAATIAALRDELAEAMTDASDSDLRFEVGQVQLELNILVARATTGTAKAKFWVVEVGGDAGYRQEEVQRISVTLEAPVDRTGRPVQVTRDSHVKP